MVPLPRARRPPWWSSDGGSVGERSAARQRVFPRLPLDPELRAIVADGLQNVYFKDGGTRADQLEVEFTDIDYNDVSF